jgi:hypothetical protein
MIIRAIANQKLVLKSGSDGALCINSANNVGIGTSIPLGKLYNICIYNNNIALNTSLQMHMCVCVRVSASPSTLLWWFSTAAAANDMVIRTP